jgi:hypothetical protein
MSLFQGALAVLRFELRRTKTLSRVAVWAALTLVPIAIVVTSLLLSNEGSLSNERNAVRPGS